ncbi:MAG: CvpA family protein [Bacteroidia bacterium]|nr:CvpA family protein [Bacteroidia bacterium]
MNWLDGIIALPLLWGAYQGFKKGIVFMLLMIIGMVLGMYIAFKFSGLIVGFLANHISATAALPYIAFALVFIIIVLVVYLLSKFLEAILKTTALTGLNKAAGAMAGLTKWALIVSVFLWMFKALEPHVYVIPLKAQDESITYNPVLKLATFITPAFTDIKRVFNNNIGKVDSLIINHVPDSTLK